MTTTTVEVSVSTSDSSMKETARRKAVHKKSKGLCTYCHKRLKVSQTTIDHIIPRSKGGSNTMSNLAACCYNCNQAKGDRTVAEWIEDLKVAEPPQRSSHEYHTAKLLLAVWSGTTLTACAMGLVFYFLVIL